MRMSRRGNEEKVEGKKDIGRRREGERRKREIKKE